MLDYLLRGTETGAVWICTLPNVKGAAPERHALTRDPERIKDFCTKWDQDGRSVFYCVSTILPGKERKKENYVETLFLHCDIDFKDVEETPEQIEAAVRAMKYKPTRIIHSGNGLHCIWLLQEPISDVERVETALRQVAFVMGADRMVCQVVALMRMPGTHNSKRNSWHEVTAVDLRTEPYALEELEGFFRTAHSMFRKKMKPQNLADVFSEIGNAQGYKTPIDVRARLAAMQYRGPGDTAVHITQLQCTAALMSAGYTVEDATDLVFKATEKIAPTDWDMDRERRAIEGMCRDMQEKMEKEEKQKKPKLVDNKGSTSSAVVSLAEKREERQKKEEAPRAEAKTAKGKAHVVLGLGILAWLKERDEDLIFEGNTPWFYSNGMWEPLIGDAWKAWVGRRVQVGCDTLKIIPTTKLVSETKGWLERENSILRSNVKWDGHKLIATKSGLVDFKTRTVSRYLPEHYATHCVQSEYDPEAKCPNWERMLVDMGFDENTRNLIQEVFGCALIDEKPRSLSRALVLVGGSNSGKSNVLRVIGGFLSDSPITVPLDTVNTTHGLQPFLKRDPWVLDEAFDQGKWHASSNVKALLSGDPVGVNIKNGPMVHCVWKSAVLWGTNTPPQFKESSRAMENRMLIVTCSAEFDPARPKGVAKLARDRGFVSPSQLVLAEERPGLLNWALEGLSRAWDRGYFDMTREVEEALHEMSLDSNMAAGFFEECVEFCPNTMVSLPDAYAAFSAWWTESTERNVPSPKAFAKAINSLADRRVVSHPTELRYLRIRYRAGMKLNEIGLDFWRAQSNASGARGDTARISDSDARVNTPIPDIWNEKAAIIEMRKHHGSQGPNRL